MSTFTSGDTEVSFAGDKLIITSGLQVHVFQISAITYVKVDTSYSTPKLNINNNINFPIGDDGKELLDELKKALVSHYSIAKTKSKVK